MLLILISAWVPSPHLEADGGVDEIEVHVVCLQVLQRQLQEPLHLAFVHGDARQLRAGEEGGGFG